MAGSSPLASTKNTVPANTGAATANLYQTGAPVNMSNKNSNHDAVNSSHHSANYRTGTELNSSQGAGAGSNVRDVNNTTALFNKTVKVISGTKK